MKTSLLILIAMVIFKISFSFPAETFIVKGSSFFDIDVTPPDITFTPLANTLSTSGRTLTVTITDETGVPTTGPGLPRLYWKISWTGTWNNVNGVSVGGDSYSFTFGEGVGPCDSVYYYIVAQDVVTPDPNIGSNPVSVGGVYTADPPAVSPPPGNLYAYKIDSDISLQVSVTDVTCSGLSTGNATVSVTGGTTPYSFLWSTDPAQTTQTATDLSAGSYTVTVTDQCQSAATASVLISEPPELLATAFVAKPVVCRFTATGSVAVSVSGGITPYSYIWNNGETTDTISSLFWGTYYVTVTDNNNCTALSSVYLSLPWYLSISISQTDVSCFGGNNGTATASPGMIGSGPPYTYMWSTTPVQTTQTATGLTAGLYAVTLTDATGCTSSAWNIPISQPPLLVAGIADMTHITCHGSGTGSITVTADGGTTGYAFKWSTSPVQTAATATSLSAGAYEVTVTDSKSCTATSTATLTEPPAITPSPYTTPVSCYGGNDGTASVTATGGVSGYTYQWNTTPVRTSQTITGLSSGSYQVTVTDTMGCTATAVTTVSQPALLVATTSFIPVSCFGGNDGTATVSATGGNGGYSYRWNTIPEKTTQTITGLTVGVYLVTVTDNKQCTATATASVTQPSLLTATASSTLVSCFNFDNGTASVTAIGGNGDYTYVWNSVPVQTTQTAINLIALTYTVTVTDSKNCTATASTLVGQPISPNGGPDQYICKGGQAQLNATGGMIYAWSPASSLSNAFISNPIATPTITTDYIVTINNPSGELVTNGDFSDGNTGFTSAYIYVPNPLPYPYDGPGGLWPEGTYTVCKEPLYYHGGTLPWGGHGHTTGSDLFMAVNGSTTPGTIIWQENVAVVPNTVYYFSAWITTCFATSSALLNFTINGASLGPTLVAPTDTSVWEQFYAVWNSGINTVATIRIVNGNTVAFGNDFGLDDILFTTVCSNTDTVTVHVSNITATISNTNTTCYAGTNGTATASASGGFGNYTYKWSTVPVQTTQTATGLSAGTYKVTVTDDLGCKGTASTTISQPPQIEVYAGPDQIFCNATNTFLIGSDPTPGIGNWTWYSGPNIPLIFPSYSSLAIAAGLSWGTYEFVYSVTVTVPGGYCTNSDTLQVTNYHLPTTAYAGLDQQICKSPAGPDSTFLDGNAAVYGTGKWTQLGGPNTALIIDPNDPKTKVKNLIDGLYKFRWEITSGICDTTSDIMQILVHTMPSAYAGPDATICGGSPDTLKYSTASDYFILSWLTTGTGSFNNPGILHPIYTPSPADIAAGQVKLILLAMGYPPCGIVTDTMVLFITAPPVPNAGPDAAICETMNYCLCGATAYNYVDLWWTTTGTGTFNDPNILNPFYTPSMEDILAGCVSLVLHVTGNPPCAEVTDTLLLCIKRIPVVYAGPDTTICSQGSYTVNLSTALYSCAHKWKTSGDGTFDDITVLHPVYTPGSGDLAAGHVTLTLFGIPCAPCPNDSDRMVLTFSYPPVINAFVITHVNCWGENNGSVSVTVTGGVTPYYYMWSDPASQTTKTATGLVAGTYTVTVTDYYNCTATSSATVTEPPLLTALTTITHVNCYTYSTGEVTLTAQGGTPGYSYVWSNGATTRNISGLSADTYTATVTDTHGCTVTSSNTVTQPPPWGPQICGPDTVCQGSVVMYCVCTPLRPGSTYQWTVTGGTILNGCCSHCVVIKWDNCSQGLICVTETRHDPPYDGCIITTCMAIYLKPVPAPMITGPTIVNVGQTATYCTPAVPGDDYNWSVIGGSVTSGQGTNCLTVTWNTYCSSCQGMLIVNELRDGCCGIDTLYVTILPGTGNLTGYVIYKNLYNTGLNGVSLELRDTLATVLGTTITGPDPLNNNPGFYSFSNLGNGKYHIGGSFNGTWGGNNATDALIIELHTAHILTMAGLNLKVGDVNADLAVNSTDALWVKLRTIGMIGYYPAGDWKIEDSTFTLTGSASINLDALCEGDVNGSFIPSGFKDIPYISQVEDGTMTIPVGESFDYDIRSSRDAMLGAMTLFLDYDRNRFEVENVVTELDGMKYLVKDGKLSLAWSNTIPMVVSNGDPVITLRMKVKESLNSATRVFDIRGGSEFAGTRAERFDNFDLRMPDLKTYGMENKFSLGNYPNPFNNTTTIVYHIPEQAHVKLVLMNMFGEVLLTLMDAGQSAGSYQVKVNPLDYNLNSGVYLYSIRVDGTNGAYNKINKMVFTK